MNVTLRKELVEEVVKLQLRNLAEQKSKIEGEMSELQGILGKRGPGRPRKIENTNTETNHNVASAQSETPTRRKRNMSPEARKRIADAQRKRWDAYHQNQKQTSDAANEMIQVTV